MISISLVAREIVIGVEVVAGKAGISSEYSVLETKRAETSSAEGRVIVAYPFMTPSTS